MAKAKPIHAQLAAERLSRGITHRQVRDGADLPCSTDSLCRKLGGKQPLTTSEAEAIARYLGASILVTTR